MTAVHLEKGDGPVVIEERPFMLSVASRTLALFPFGGGGMLGSGGVHWGRGGGPIVWRDFLVRGLRQAEAPVMLEYKQDCCGMFTYLHKLSSHYSSFYYHSPSVACQHTEGEYIPTNHFPTY